MKVKAGIIGGGFGLRVQAPIIHTHPYITLTSICTMYRKHDLNDVSHYENWREMLDDEDLDLIFVCSLPIFHYEIVAYALEKGIHVVCEKPFTMNSSQSESLLQFSKASCANVLIDFEWRYLPIRQKAKELIRTGEIGQLIHFEYHVSLQRYKILQTEIQGWMGERRQFGGMLGAIGTHMIDCLRWLTRSEVAKVISQVNTHVPEGAGERRDADDAFFIHGQMNNNTTFSLQLLSGVHHGFGSHLRIFGNQGTIEVSNDRVLTWGKAGEQLKEIQASQTSKVPEHLSQEAKAYYPAFYPFLEKAYEYFVARENDIDLPMIYDGHANQLVLDQILGC